MIHEYGMLDAKHLTLMNITKEPLNQNKMRTVLKIIALPVILVISFIKAVITNTRNLFITFKSE